MDAINTTSPSGADNVTGLLSANNTTGTAWSFTDNLTQYILVTLGILAGSWIILCAVMYFIVPYFGKFANLRSRIAYSAVYSLPFAVIIALGLGGLMPKSLTLESVLLMLLIVFAMVMLQSFLLGVLISKGIIKMESRRQRPGTVNGTRNVKGKRK